MTKTLKAALAAAVLLMSIALSACGTNAGTDISVPEKSALSMSEYERYIASKSPAPPEALIEISAADFDAYSGEAPQLTNIEGTQALRTWASGSVSFRFTAEYAGLYHIQFVYCPLEGYGDTIERALYLDGALPYEEAKNLLFTRRFEDEGEKRFSTAGNEYRRSQKEVFGWYTASARSGYGFTDDALKLYLTAGEHTLTLEGIREPMALSLIRFYVGTDPVPYRQALAEYEAKGLVRGTGIIVTEAEDASAKSASTLYAVEDRSSPETTPYDSKRILLNGIGSSNWKYSGQWIEWTVNVPSEGLYNISFRVKQDYVSGASAVRRLSVNGQVPFREAENLKVPYSLNWQIFTPGDADGAYYFHFREGENIIRLEVVTGELAPILNQVRTTVGELTLLYRRVNAVVGSFPDPLRDYHLESAVPDLMPSLQKALTELNAASGMLNELGGANGEQSAYIDQLSVLLETMLKRKDIIPEQLSTLSDRMNSLSSWVASASEVPLLIDKLAVHGGDEALTREGSFARRAAFSFDNFVSSFTVDYYTIENMLDQETSREVTLWLASTSGRDQASILRDLSDSFFTRETGIRLNIRLVDMSVLWQAVANGAGPDAAILQGQAQPLNYGVRGALYDLSTFDDCDEVLARFDESAVTPFRLRESVYGLPEQQVYLMMFVRTDILDEMGLAVPETWDELYALVPALQEQGMEIGLPQPSTVQSGSDSTALNPMFTTLLLQQGARVYDSDNRLCTLDDPLAVDCFTQWAEFYTKYNFTKSYSAINRFRTGVMPIVIADYTLYNSLVIAAPEIEGAWAMYPIPGTRRADGSIGRETSGSQSACMIFANATDPEASWEFLKWWTSAETQERYGRELESIQGASARWPTANLEAFERLGWTPDVLSALRQQRTFVRGIPEVPGGYYVGRSVSNAIKSVINMGESPRETILDAVEDINREILSKRREFGLEGAQ